MKPVGHRREAVDGIASEDDLLSFFKKLPVGDREFVVLPGAAHLIAFGAHRRQFFHIMRSFLEMPKRLDVATDASTEGRVSR